jgi:FtsP/CotA-like multicopper oxidase with cupredoxin domain
LPSLDGTDELGWNGERMAPDQAGTRSDGDSFPTSAEGLPSAVPPELVELADGQTFDLEIAPVAKTINGATVRMLAYNGSIPGPTLKVSEGSRLTVRATNHGDTETTVHWHGLRLENRYDGTHETQSPVSTGDTFTYELSFPDPGVYWYHPHIREDYAQEMGLYGNILVVPSEPDYWPTVDREVVLTLDDILIEDGRVAGFSPTETTHVAMGRFGNVMLVSGEQELSLSVLQGEVVRFYLTNTANTRVFNVTIPNVRMKLVGADSGHYEREEFVDAILIAPSERVVIDALFDEPGVLTLVHRTPAREYRLATIVVDEGDARPASSVDFDLLRVNEDMARERERIVPYFSAAPDKTLAFVAELDMGVPDGRVVYSCPMHPDVVSDEPGSCPKCGMKLLAISAPADAHYVCPTHPKVTSDAPHHCPECGMKLVPAQFASADRDKQGLDEQTGGHTHDSSQGIEWEDDMAEVNRVTTARNTTWKLIDRATGAENAAIDWRFRVGEQVMIRLINEIESDHPMPHPFHIHGAGRFLVVARNNVPEPNLIWKDTVFVRTGEVVDILLDVTNAGVWMAHCHIAEHHESGMMFSFRVDDRT